MAKDYYQILGIPKSATEDEIKKAYRKLAHKHHPDKGGEEKKFKEINEAYQILSNKEKRAQYDQFGRVFEGGAGPQGQPGWDFGANWQGASGGPDFEFDFGDIGDIGDLGDLFGEMFGFGGRRSGRREKNIKKL